MDQVFLLLLTATTSLAAIGVGVRGLGLSPARLRVGVQCALEVVGAAVAFFAINLTVGLSAILALRTFTNHFVSVYLLNDLVLFLLSAVQGIVFHCWRRS